MESTAHLSAGPVHKATRDLMDSKMLEMEGRCLLIIKKRNLEMAKQVSRVEAVLTLKIAELRDRLAALEAKYASADKSYTQIRDYHTEDEIKELILAHGHRLPHMRFSGRAYAEELQRHIELRPGDERKDIRGGIAFYTRVSRTIWSWMRAKSKKLGDECPLEKAGDRAYRIKEGFQWPSQPF